MRPQDNSLSKALAFFVHPLPLAAVALMAINDHWLKHQYPNWFTGKLSDFCGVFYFPIFLLALGAVLGFRPTRRSTFFAIALTDLLLITVKLSAPVARMIEQFFNAYLFSIQITQDETDLIALLMNPLTFLYLSSAFNYRSYTRSKDT